MYGNRTSRAPTQWILVIRRSSRSAIAPASGPSSSAGSSVAIHTPLTAALCTATAPTADCPAVCLPARFAASTVSARMLSQSPRLDRDRAVHSRRNGLIDRTPGGLGLLGDRRSPGPAPLPFARPPQFPPLSARDPPR